MYQTVDAALEGMDAGCFAACPQPRNTTSTCWLKCFDGVIAATPVDELVKPWEAAFGDGGCPQVTPASLRALGVDPVSPATLSPPTVGRSAAPHDSAPPLVVQQWSANISQAVYYNGALDTGYTNPSFEVLSLDVPNDRYRIENHGGGGSSNTTQIWVLNTPHAYYIETDLATGVISSCSKLPIPPNPGQPNVTLSLLSVDLGAGTLAGGESVEMWAAHIPSPPEIEEYAVQATAAAGNAPMMLRQNSTTQHASCPIPRITGPCSQWMVRDNTKDLIVGPQAVPEWMFVPPAECNGQLPKAKAAELLKAAAARQLW